MTDLLIEGVKLAIDIHNGRGESEAAAQLERELIRVKAERDEARRLARRVMPIEFRVMPRDMRRDDILRLCELDGACEE